MRVWVFILMCFMTGASGVRGAPCLAATTNNAVPESFYREMESLIQSGRTTEALPKLRRSLHAHPRDTRLLNLLGLACTANHRLEAADTLFEVAVKLAPDFVPALRNLAINEETLGLHKQAIEHFEQVLKLRTNDQTAAAFVGSDSFTRRDYGRVVELLGQVGCLSTNPTVEMEKTVAALALKGKPVSEQDTESLRSLELNRIEPGLLMLGGLALGELEDYRDAASFLKALPDVWQSHADVAYDGALLLIRSQRAVEAASLLEGYLDEHEHTGAMLNLVAEAYAINGNTQKAIDSLREAITLEPKVEDHYIDLAEICAKFDAYDVGIQVLNVGLRLLPDADRLYFERGVLEEMKNDLGVAESDFRRAQVLAPTKTMAGLAIGVGMMHAGQHADAVEELKAKATADPSNAVIQYMLAEALLQNIDPTGGSNDEARKALQRAISNDASYEPPLVELGRLEIQAKHFDAAHTLLTRAASLSPEDSAALYQLVIVDHRMGLKDEADTLVAKLTEISQKELDDRHRMQIRIGPSQ